MFFITEFIICIAGQEFVSVACTNVVLQLVGFGFGHRNTTVDWLEAWSMV